MDLFPLLEQYSRERRTGKRQLTFTLQTGCASGVPGDVVGWAGEAFEENCVLSVVVRVWRTIDARAILAQVGAYTTGSYSGTLSAISNVPMVTMTFKGAWCVDTFTKDRTIMIF